MAIIFQTINVIFARLQENRGCYCLFNTDGLNYHSPMECARGSLTCLCPVHTSSKVLGVSWLMRISHEEYFETSCFFHARSFILTNTN